MGKGMYQTWYEFKKDLQNRSRRGILNKEWLEIKPREPLPWDHIVMRSTLSKLSKVHKIK
jgi:hypothetical protein